MVTKLSKGKRPKESKMETKITKATERKLVKIAQQEILALESRADLEQQMSDSLDFIDGIAVWEIKAALIAAYNLGRAAAKEGK